MFGMEKRQSPSSGRTAKKKKKRGSVKSAAAASKAEYKKEGGECAGESGLQTATATRLQLRRPAFPKVTKCMKFTGCDYLMGFKPIPNYNYETSTNPNLIPEGALLEHRPHFSDMWRRYHTQLQSTNGMDLDTYPGCSMLADSVPVVLSPKTDDYAVAMELIDLALEIYNNDPSNVFKYKFLKIEKENLRFTGFLLFFMTLKFLNVTLGTVVETFKIYAGESNCGPYQELFSCVSKAGPLM